MKKLLVAFLFSLTPFAALAAGGPSIPLDHVELDMSDTESLQRGAQLYMNFCMGCHSLEYGRYNRIAKDLDIPEEIFMDNLVFTDAKFGDLMENAIPAKQAKEWFGAAPPDLTLLTKLKGGSDWLYTYLRGFYADDSRPYGVNNTVFKDVGMPHVLIELQGLCADKPEPTGDAKYDPLTGKVMSSGGCNSYVVEGSMSKAEYDGAARDLVNFLSYMADPAQQQRHRLGWLVIAFLVIFYAVSALYVRELKKDIH